MIRSRFEAEKCNFSEINVRIIFSEVSEVSLFSFIGMPWNSKLNSFERSSCMIAALRLSVACSWSSVSRLASLLSRFSIFSWATSKLVSTAVIRRFRLDSICARHRSTDWSNWNTSFSVGSLCAFCAIGFLECLKVIFSMTLQATALTRSSLLLGCLDGMIIANVSYSIWAVIANVSYSIWASFKFPASDNTVISITRALSLCAMRSGLRIPAVVGIAQFLSTVQFFVLILVFLPICHEFYHV